MKTIDVSSDRTMETLWADAPCADYADKMMLYGQFVGDWEFDWAGFDASRPSRTMRSGPLGADGAGDAAQVAAGIVRAADAGPRVLNPSLGAPATDEALAQAVSYAAAERAIVVAVSGNNDTSTPFYSTAYPDVVGVAGTDESEHLYPWSNFGSWSRSPVPAAMPPRSFRQLRRLLRNLVRRSGRRRADRARALVRPGEARGGHRRDREDGASRRRRR